MNYINILIYNDNEIHLNQRHLIITGKNGVGKTRFLNNLRTELEKDKNTESHMKKILREQISEILKNGINNYPLSLNLKNQEIKYINKFRNNYDSEFNYTNHLLDIQNLIDNKYKFFNKKKKSYFLKTDSTTQDEHLKIENPDSILENYYYYNNPYHIDNFYKSLSKLIEDYLTNTKGISVYPINHPKNIYYFESSRVSSNLFTMTVFQSFESFKNNQQKHDVEDALGAFLVDQRMAFYDLMKFREPEEHNQSAISARLFDTNEIERWFLKIEKDLQIILENPTIELSFTKKGDQVLIIQKDKDISFSFDSLSSGFKAVFNIYANLLVRAQFQEVAPEELIGIAIIDEIDVHLHISLQKKVLPFLIKAFPKIQFIVSTHSPFVITSTDNDTVVYDISNGEFFDEDLSRYSYESLIKGLFHVDTQSDHLKTEIQTIATILNSDPNNYEKLRETLKNITPYAKQLDVESKSFYFKALNHLLDNQELGELDV
ncbi:AAA family ATPase [Acinetobacter gyllenbergii]|uniref:AAA family ATPase n=1 Tax=Acinetobacter gyllenbergii TaxID=134534 RepID=UPI003AF70B79